MKLQANLFEELGRRVNPPKPPPPPRKKTGHANSDGWAPKLNPKQQESFDSPARYILAYGEKGSGKTIGLLHKMVRHCWENRNALGLILVREKAMATKGGSWDKLIGHVLPRWKEGNRDLDGKLVDDGLGIDSSAVKFDNQQNEYVWIENRHGSWSMIGLISAPHGSSLRARMRGYEPSIMLVDELTSCDSHQYLTAVAIQVGRREGVEGPQQYMAACNPEGPSHWVYKAWFEDPFDPLTGTWDEDWHKIHIPIQENAANLPPGYIENLEKIYRNDPVEAARMLRGEWIDRPTGQALFFDIFIPLRHIRPPLPTLERVLPDPGFPLIIGIDPGTANNAFIFMQWLLTEGAMKWLIFDEMVYIQRRIRYEVLIGSLLRRLQWWNHFIFGRDSVKRFPVVYSADDSAFNQFRPGSNSGASFDVMDFERIANEKRASGTSLVQLLGLAKMKVMPAPKFSGSRRIRTRLVMDLLGAEEIIVSAGCPKVIEMFNHLESEPQKPGEFDADLALTPRRSPHLHPFDALCNPILTSTIKPRLLVPVREVTQEMFRIGA